MGRTMLALGVSLALVCVIGGAALAARIPCDVIPCVGTDTKDLMYERVGTKKDRIFGLKSDDLIDANTFTGDKDQLYGQDGRDRLLSNDGDRRDVVKGGKGRDTCIVDRGDRTSSCEIVRFTRTVSASSESGDLPPSAFR